MSAPVRIGLAGYGLGGRFYHAPLIASADNCEFLGVITTSPECRRRVAEDLGRPVFASLADLASAAAEAVAISAPVPAHVTLTQRALRLGLEVVCDKPFAPDADSARRVARLAEMLNVPLTVYQNRRWDSDFLTVRELLDKGSLGALIVLESRFERFRPEYGLHAAGGGTLLDFGSHLVDQALVLAGPVTGVYAEVHHRAGTGGLDDVFVALTHQSGVRSHLWGSWRQGAPARGSAPPEPRPPMSSRTSTARKPSYAAGRRRRQKAGSGASSRRNGGATSGVARPPSPYHRPGGAWNLFYPAFAGAVRGT